jgi:hypothetical protein
MSGAFYNVWELLCKRAGVLGKDGKHKRLHDRRRSGVRRLERSGVSREVAKRLIGHKTDSMYARYNIVTDDDLRAGVAKAAGGSVAMSRMSRQTNGETREPSEAGV